MNVAILGGSASGLMAAWAVINAGHCPRIFDKHPRPPNPQTGFFYLHEPCDLPLRSKTAQVLVTGASPMDDLVALYRKKVYGDVIGPPVSISDYLSKDEINVFDGGQALNLLWDIVGPFVHDGGAFSWDELCGMECWADAQRIISTIPLNQFILSLQSQTVWIKASEAPVDESYVLYNVNPYVGWYRASALFGHFNLEYAHCPNPNWVPGFDKHYLVNKVISLTGERREQLKRNTPENVLLTGRYGKWDKSTMLHDVYRDVLEWLS